MTRQTMIQSRQTRIAPQDSDPNFWTAERMAVMDVLFRRSEFDVRTRSMTPDTKKGSRWRPYASSRTKHLFEPNDPVLTAKNVGPAIKALIDWGYIHRISTSVAKVEFTVKGWAWLAFRKKFDPAWFSVIYSDHADIDLIWTLYRGFRNSDKLRALSSQYAGGLQEKVVADIMEPSPMTEDMPFVEKPSDDELPGLPEFDAEVTGLLERRAHDGDEVIRTRLQLARDFHHKTDGALSKLEPREIDKAISRHFSSEEVLRADLELIRDQRKGPRESYYSRELVNRMSQAGEFERHTLAAHLGTGHAKLEGLARGAERIAFGLEAQALREAGISRAMPGSTTLGDIADRLRAESVSAMGAEDDLSIPDPNTIMDAGKPYRRDEAIADVISHGEDWRTALTFMRDNAAPATVDSDDVGYWQHQLNVLDRILLALDIATEPTPLTPDNIAAASEAAKAEDDALPMVDWIDRQLGQNEYDGWVPKDRAAIVARAAVLRHMKQNPMGAPISGEGKVVQYDGFRLHVRQRDYMAFEGRPCTISMSVESDYDPDDTAHVEKWFHEFVHLGTKAMRGELVERDDSFAALQAKAARHYAYPAGANVDHQVVGDLEDIKVRSINPIWMVAMMFGSSFLALVLFVVFLSIIPFKGV